MDVLHDFPAQWTWLIFYSIQFVDLRAALLVELNAWSERSGVGAEYPKFDLGDVFDTGLVFCDI